MRGALRLYRARSLQWPFDITAGPDGALWFTNFRGRSVGRISVTGKIRTYTGPSIDEPGHVTAGLDGTIWFTDGTARSGGSREPAS